MAPLALVIGGGGAIGGAVCRALAGQSFTVAVADIKLDFARQTASQLEGSGHQAFEVDVTDESSVAALFRDAEQDLGPVVALICVAGGTLNTRDHRPTVDEITLEEWQKTTAMNSQGTFLAIREYVRRRRQQPVKDGRIVTFSSLAGQSAGSPTGAAYAASKAAILGLTRHVAAEVAPLGITANSIAPGAVETGAFRATVKEEQAKAVAANTPVQRIGVPDDIAAAVAFLVSPASSFITGTTMDVNGGRGMR